MSIAAKCICNSVSPYCTGTGENCPYKNNTSNLSTINAESKLEQAANSIVHKLDDFARDFDVYEYGLPTMQKQKELEGIVISTIKEYWQSLTTPASNECDYCDGQGWYINEDHPKYPEVQQKIDCYHCTPSKPHTVEEGQTQEPVSLYEALYLIVGIYEQSTQGHYRNLSDALYDIFKYADKALKDYTPPPAPIKTEGEDEKIEVLKEIMSKFGEAHNLLAKTKLTTEEYQPISSLLANAKIQLFNFYKKFKAPAPPSPVGIDVEAEAKKYAGIKVPLRVKDYSAATKRVYEAFKAGYSASLPQSTGYTKSQILQAAKDGEVSMEEKGERMFTLEEMFECWNYSCFNGRQRHMNRKEFKQYAKQKFNIDL